MKRLLLPLLATVIVGACDDPTDDDSLRVRAENASTSLTLEDVLIGFESDTLELGNVGPGAITSYSRLDAPQELVLVSLRADGVTHTMEPAPGSIVLDDEEVTVVLDVASGGGGILLEVVHDD